MEIWALVAPDSGTHDVQVDLSAPSPGNRGDVIGVTTFDGVDQSTPYGAFISNVGAGSMPTVNIASAPNELVYGVMAIDVNGNVFLGNGTASWDLGAFTHTVAGDWISTGSAWGKSRTGSSTRKRPRSCSCSSF